MITRLITAMVVLFGIVSCAGHKPPPDEVTIIPNIKSEQVTAPFILGEGDQLSINVWRQEDLKRTITIDPTGYIYYPLVGQIKAAGLNVPQLRQELTTLLSEYIVDPQVDVNVVELKSQEIYVLGEVKTPGVFLLDRKTSAIQAIAKAGGFTRDSNTNDILLLRDERELIRVSAINLDIKNVQKQNSYRNVGLRNGDILYVPPLKIASVEDFMTRLNNILQPIVSLERSIVLGGDAYDTITGKRNATVLAQ